MTRGRDDNVFTDTELRGGKDRDLLAVEYQERKEKKEKQKKQMQALGLTIEEPNDTELKTLHTTHKFILALYMTGKYSQVEVAKQADVHYTTVWKVIHSKLGKEVIKDWKEMLQVELDGLMPLAVGAVREGLMAGDKMIKLRAVDRFIKMTRGEEGDTNVTVNVINDARGRFITDLKDLAEQEGLIELEGEAEVVDSVKVEVVE